jgi:undecaprenyl-diphosphatase
VPVVDIFKAVILGIVEGLTEFLPVSSTGHMILVQPLLGINPDEPPWHAFLYFIQIGAIFAVIVYFWRRLWRQILRLRAGGVREHILTKLAVASIPAAAVGLPMSHWVEVHLESPAFVAAMLIVGAGIMEIIERYFRRADQPDVAQVTLRQAFLIGVAQCLSILPGMSRAMTTIMGGLVVGLSPAAATEFSFYLAIPTLLGAGLLKIVKHRDELHAHEATVLGVGFCTAFIAAILVVHPFLQFVKNHRLRAFAVYRVVLGAIVLAWWLVSR